MGRHPVDVLKAALQEAKTEAATLRIKTATLAKERNIVIEERNKARARVKELEQQNAVQRENVDEAMRQNTRLSERLETLEENLHDAALFLESADWHLGVTRERTPWDHGLAAMAAKLRALDASPPVDGTTSDNAPLRKPVGGPEQDRGGAALPPAGSEARIRELEAEVERLQRDRAQVGAFGFRPAGIR